MKNIVRPLNRAEISEYMRIAMDAFPSDKGYTREEVEKKVEEFFNETANGLAATIHGLFRDGRLLGGMKLYDFQFNFHHTITLMGGVGGVAVDLLHKKERVAKGLLEYFIEQYDLKGACMVSLYAFRLDFYKKMGFGFGNKTSQYTFSPDTLLKYPSKANIRYLAKADLPQIEACYNRYAQHTHGMFLHGAAWMAKLFDKGNYWVGYFHQSQLKGYLQFSFTKGDGKPYGYDLTVFYQVFETRAAFFELIAFLRSQLDQVGKIIFDTQDDDFYHLLTNPWNGVYSTVRLHHRTNIQETGICYRVINVARTFKVLKYRNFNGINLKLKITVRDSFYPKNDGSTIVHFIDGFPSVVQTNDVEVAITLDISEFSSLIMGVIGFKKLYNYNLAVISSKIYILTVDKLFSAAKPMCVSRF